MDMKTHHQLCILLLSYLCIAGCISQTGSFNSPNAYYGHFEKKGTGQLTGQIQPFLLSGKAIGAYAVTNHLFVQGGARLSNSGYSGKTNYTPSADVLFGFYKHRHQYQSLTFGIGGGAGKTTIVNSSRLYGRFDYLHTTAQIGLSENYGPTRISLGLNHKMINFYAGQIYLGDDNLITRKLELLASQRLNHALSGHLGWSYRVDKSLRLQASYDFTFASMDYNLYDRDSFHAGLIVDIGNMSRPVSPPKVSRKKDKTKRKKKVYDAQDE
jgi:hypothetical protein